MAPHLSGHKFRKTHLALGAMLAGGALLLALWPAMGWGPATRLAIPVGVIVAIHVVVILAAAGALIASLRAHSRTRRPEASELGTTLHSARLYDWLATAMTFGRETRMRERTLDAAGISTGEHVLDVGSGTGTLSVTARKRVGPKGSVHGVDASPEMVAAAGSKSLRSGLPVTFAVAPAQSLPFPDASFDVVLCSLALHHLPQDARPTALAEMRRVLKPGGRALIVEFSRGQGISSLLHPIVLLHALENPRMLEEAAGLLRGSGFQAVATGSIGVAGLGYAFGRRD